MTAIKISGEEIHSRQTASLMKKLLLLRRDETGPFQDFLDSPYFTKDKKPLSLFRHLQAAQKEGSASINGKTLIKKLFAGLPEENGIERLGKLLKELQSLVDEFLIYQEMRSDPDSLQPRALIQSLRKRHAPEQVEKAYEAFRRQLDSKPLSLKQAADRWWLEHQTYFQQNDSQYQADDPRFRSACSSFDELSRLVGLRSYCEAVNRRNLVSDTFPMEPLEEAAGALHSESPVPVMELYRMTILLLRNRDNGEHYARLKQAFVQNHSALAADDRLVVLKALLNACAYQYEGGHPEAAREIFDLCTFGVDQAIFLFDDVISDGDYLNVALSAVAVRRFDYQHQFIHQYRKRLNEAHQKKAFHLAMAYYYFHQDKFKEAITELEGHFRRYAHDEPVYSLRAKSLLVRAYLTQYVEHEERYVEYEEEIEKLRKFIERKNVLTPERRLPYGNFIGFCRDIFRLRDRWGNLRSSERREEKARLLAKLEGAGQVVMRQWLAKLISRL